MRGTVAKRLRRAAADTVARNRVPFRERPREQWRIYKALKRDYKRV